MPLLIQTTPFYSRPITWMTLCLAAMTVGCSQQTAPDQDAEQRIMPVARFELGATAMPTEAAPAEAAAATEEVAVAASSGQKDGATVYAQICKTCHDLGISGAPKMGDVAAWAPRIATGMDALYQSSLNGKNVMPPKGGNSSLSDTEVMGAVDFMVAASR